MKILWIEDFGGRLARSKIVVEIFNAFFEEINLEKEYDEANPDVAAQLFELFRKHTLHEVYVCKSYVEWKQLDAQHRGDFDIALVDINLESEATPDDERPEGIESPEFDKKAGFYIYHQLIKRGFPDDNIAFFTGEGQSLKEFSLYCGGIFLDKPAHCFLKNPANFKQLRRWLAEKTVQQSLILRRGVIEGCRCMKEKIESTDRSGLEASLIFYKTTVRNVNNDPEAFRKEAIDYLTRLERFFLPHQTSDNTDTSFIFVRELVAKWEGSSYYFIRSKEIPRFETKLEERFNSTSQFQMKLLRNWSEHNLLSDSLTARDLAYFFMLAMRSWVGSDLRLVFSYERILSSLFTGSADIELGSQVKARLEYHLEQSYSRLSTLYLEMKKHVGEPAENRRHDNHFLEKFRGVGDLVDVIRRDETLRATFYEFYRRKVREQSLRLFYESYWHGLFPLYLGKPLYANLQSVGFNLEPIPDSFLSFLGQLILGECFREEVVEVNVA